MIARVIFELQDGDPPWDAQVEVAFNRVINFCPELLPSLEHYAHADPALAQVKASMEQAAENLLQIVEEFARWFTAVQDKAPKVDQSKPPADAAHAS